MATYKVYAGFGECGRMVCIYSFEKPDDVAAEAFVLERMTREPVELWCRARRVVRFEGKKRC